MLNSPTLIDSLITEEITEPIEASLSLKSATVNSFHTESNFENFLDLTRRWVNEEKFKIQLQVLQGIRNTESASQLLTNVAEKAFENIWQAVERGFVRRHGKIPNSSMVAIAYGKFGGRELMPGSDLDLVFVYKRDKTVELSDGARPLHPSLYFTRFAQRICRALSAPTSEGKLYEIDLQLRPSGRIGPVVVEIDGYFEYLRTRVWSWELMALTRARPIAGPFEVQSQVSEGIRKTLTFVNDKNRLRTDVVAMRKKMIAHHGEISKWNIKHRIGGIVDIEFILQYLQLANAIHREPIFSTNSSSALENLENAGILAGNAATSLRESFQFWQWLNFMIRVIGPNYFEKTELQNKLFKVLVRHSSFSTIEEVIGEMDFRANAVKILFYDVFRNNIN